MRQFDAPTVSVVKHTIPCGLATREILAEAFDLAVAGDPVSAFGGIVALNREVDLETAKRIGDIFFEVIITPGFSDEAFDALGRKKSLRLLRFNNRASGTERPTICRAIEGGLLVQNPDTQFDSTSAWKVVTDRQPTEDEQRDLAFAWNVCRAVKSNAIVFARGLAVTGVGSGQPNQLESVRIAASKAGDRAVGSVLASDAFFPFADGLEAAINAGITAIQPGGSVRDDEVIAAADRAGIAMIFTGTRHFLH